MNSDHKLTPEMVRTLEAELVAKKAELAKVSRSRGKCRPVSRPEDGDNDELMTISSQEREIKASIDSIQRTLDTCQVIELDSSDKSIVSVGAVVTVEVSKIGCEDEEPFEWKLTLSKDNKWFGFDSEISNFTINSPIGKCILGKKVGYVGEYVVTGNRIEASNRFKCKILSIQY